MDRRSSVRPKCLIVLTLGRRVQTIDQVRGHVPNPKPVTINQPSKVPVNSLIMGSHDHGT